MFYKSMKNSAALLCVTHPENSAGYSRQVILAHSAGYFAALGRFFGGTESVFRALGR